jgi:hypothetical protein
MNITRVTRMGPGCTIDTDTGRYGNWPGKTSAAGLPWWSYTPTNGRGPRLVTDPEIIATLEQERSLAQHPSSQSPRPHLTVVRDADWCDPHGMERPA